MTDLATDLSTVVQRSPFKLAETGVAMPVGTTIAEAVARCDFPEFFAPHVQVFIDDWKVPRDLWSIARPKAGHVIYIRVMPGKGGGGGGGGGGRKNPLGTVLSLAVMFVAPGIGNAIAGALGLGGTTFLGISAGTIFGIGASLVGNALINSLVSVPAPAAQDPGLPGASSSSWGQTPPSYSITGTQNRLQPYAPIPRILGRILSYPLMAARPYTESVGADRYVRMLLLVGYGPVKISDIRIGQTPISAFTGVEIEVTEGGPEGWAGNASVTLYTRLIREDSLSVTLTNAGGWQTRTTRPDTSEISIDIGFPRGLIQYNADGSRSPRTVTLELEYRAVGNPTWLTPTWLNATDSGLSVNGVITATEMTQAAAVRSARWAPGAAGQYEVRIRRTTATGTDHQVDDSVWQVLRSVQSETPVQKPGLAMIAVRIKASDQLNGLPDSINCIAESYHQVWNGTSWSWQLTRNPAWQSIDLLRRRGQKTLMADSRLDLATFMSFAAVCDATPTNGAGPYWAYDGKIEGGSISAALHTILSHGRASHTMRDGKHSVVWDSVQTVPAQHISPRNSWAYSGSKKFIDLPHALHVKFTNADKGYQEDICTVYSDGYSEANATRFETIEYYGCTRSDQAWRIGRYLIAVGELRPEDHSVYLDVENLRCTRGDLVHFSHDVILVGLGSGRLASVTVVSGMVTALTLDGPVEMANGISYGLRARRSDGQSVIMAVQTVFGAQVTLTLVTPIPTSLGPAAGDLWQFGESGEESAPMIIKKIDPGPDLTARITMVDYAPGVLSADSGTIPPFNSWISSSVTPRNQAPDAPSFTLRSDATVLLRLADGTLQDRIAVAFGTPTASAAPAARYELRYRESGSTTWSATIPVPLASGAVYLAPVLMGVAYDVAARAISQYDVPSDWTQADPHTVIGKSDPPGDIPWATLDDGVINWGMTLDQDIAGSVWRWQPGTNRSWGDANALHTGLIPGTSWRPPFLPNGAVTILGKLVDVIGNESVAPAAIITNLGDPLIANVIYTRDCHALGFPGTLSGATVDGVTGDLIADEDASPLAWFDDVRNAWTTDSALAWASATYIPLSYIDRVEIAAGDAGAQLTLDTAIAASGYAIDYRRDGAELAWTDDLAPAWTNDSALAWTIAAWQSWPGAVTAQLPAYEFRISANAGTTRGRISVLKMLLDVPNITESLGNVAIADTGTRLPITRAYRAITAVNLTLQADGGTARTLEVADKLISGPRVLAYDSSHIATTASVDAFIQGY